MTPEELARLTELENMVHDLIQILLPIVRAQAMASTTVSNKWRELEGETFFRDMNKKNCDKIEKADGLRPVTLQECAPTR